MQSSDIKTLLQRIKRIMHSLKSREEINYLYENYDNGLTITWRFANVTSPQQIHGDVETAAVWLWSLKDYLKARLGSVQKNSNVVEHYVNGCQYLPVLADIANVAKHGKLVSSRSGRFAKLGACEMSIPKGLALEAVIDPDADVQMTVNDPASVVYKIAVEDQHGNQIVDAFVLLRESLVEWEQFIRTQPDFNTVL